LVDLGLVGDGGVNSFIDIIKSDPGQRTGKLAELASIPPKICEKWLARLKQENKIEFQKSLPGTKF